MAGISLGELSEDDKARFWSSVDKRTPIECWVWLPPLGREGYGSMAVNSRTVRANQLALIIDGRPKPDPESVACHTCDNPSCVNPQHLWWGSRKQNAQDAARKGRWSRPLGNRVTAHHLNLMRLPLEKIDIEAKKWRVSSRHLLKLRSNLRKRNPIIGDPLNGLGHPGIDTSY